MRTPQCMPSTPLINSIATEVGGSKMRLSSLVLIPTLTLAWTSVSLQSFRRAHGRNSVGRQMASIEDDVGLNELHTLLVGAALSNDFDDAKMYSDELLRRLTKDEPPKTEEELRNRRLRMSWPGLGAADWLTDRLFALNYTFPTTVQINAMEAVNAILNVPDEILSTTTLGERVDMSNNDMGIVVSGTTGSGKTLAYLVPTLSTLSDSLFARQRIRIGDEERVIGDTAAEFAARVMATTSPEIRSPDGKAKRGGIATGASISTLGSSGSDVKKPLVLIVVPTRELGTQVAAQVYTLVGGNVGRKKIDYKNAFKYKGPKGVKIACVLDKEEASFGMKLQTDIAITTPKFLGKLVKDGDIDPTRLRIVIYDEADLGLEQTDAAVLDALFVDETDEERDYNRLTFLVGASVTESLGKLAVRAQVLPEGKSYIATATKFAPLVPTTTKKGGGSTKTPMHSESSTASLEDLDLCMDPGLKHERVLSSGKNGMLSLTRMLRAELDDYRSFHAANPESGAKQPRVVVFFPSEEEASAAISTLRDALWGEHMVCVLLPETGYDPLRIMNDFKLGKTSVMIATPNSVRGLDFPELTSVYTLYLPVDDPREYIHLAGRVGRVGQMGSAKGIGGRVVSIVRQEDASKLDDLADELGFEFEDVLIPGETLVNEGEEDIFDIEKARRFLEDTISLVDLVDEPDIDMEKVKERERQMTYYDDEDDDDLDEDDGED